MSLSKSLFKNKAGEIKLTANNLLDKMNQVNTHISATQIKNTTGFMPGRYVLVGFIYPFAPPKQN